MRKTILLSLFLIIMLCFVCTNDVYAEEFSEDKIYSLNPQLNESIINKVKKGMNNLDINVDISDECNKYYGNLSQNELLDAIMHNIEYVTETFDDYGFIKSSGISYSSGYVKKVTVNLIYNSDIEDLRKKKCEIDNVIVDFKKNYIKDCYTDFQKEMAVIDYIDDNCEYDYSLRLPYIYSAYGTLVNNKAVCEGYSKAANLLFKACNLESYLVMSQEVNHAWNKIKIDNKYYNVDLTFADGCYDYRNINISDDEAIKIYKTVSTSKCTDFLSNNMIPKCTSTDFYYFNKNVKRPSGKSIPTDCIYCNEINKLFLAKNNELLMCDIYGNNIQKITQEVSNVLGIYKNHVIYNDLKNNIKAYGILSGKKSDILSLENYTYIRQYSLSDNKLTLNLSNMRNNSSEDKLVDLSLSISNDNKDDSIVNDNNDKKQDNERVNIQENTKEDEKQKETNNTAKLLATASIATGSKDGHSETSGDNNLVVMYCSLIICVIFMSGLIGKKRIRARG